MKAEMSWTAGACVRVRVCMCYSMTTSRSSTVEYDTDSIAHPDIKRPVSPTLVGVHRVASPHSVCSVSR